MNGHVFGSISLKLSNACDHVLGCNRLNACVFTVSGSNKLNASAFTDTTTNAVTSMIEARMRRILESINFYFCCLNRLLVHPYPPGTRRADQRCVKIDRLEVSDQPLSPNRRFTSR